MAETFDELKRNRRYWQRLMRFAGYYNGKTDGILGRQNRAAETKWLATADEIKAKLGTFDSRSERNMATLLPMTQWAARQWLKLAKPMAEAEGCDVRIICGTRTYDEQDALYRKRPRVTKAKAGSSMHNFGLAWDFGIFEGKTYHGEHPCTPRSASCTPRLMAWSGAARGGPLSTSRISKATATPARL